MSGADEAGRERRTTTLFPSLGFFGGGDADALAIPLDGPVGRLVLRVPDGGTGSVDLRGVRLIREGAAVPIDPGSRHVRQSSYPEGRDPRADPFALQRIQTRAEPDSWWLARFDAPVTADLLRIHNRTDAYGYRVRQLVVGVAPPHGAWRTVATVGMSADVDRLVSLVEQLTGLDVRPDTCTDATVGPLRATMMRSLAERAGEAPMAHDLDEARRLLAVVPTGHGQAPPTLTDDERTVLGSLLAAQFAHAERTPSSFASFAFALRTRAELDRLLAQVNRSAPAYGLPALVITRHGLRVESALRTSGEDYLALVKRVEADFASLGLPLMLGYGTLLGAVREDDFLAHDDDVDLLYPIEATGRKQARPQIDALCEQLQGRGWLIWRNDSVRALNFHVIDPETGRRVDLFPVLVGKRHVRMHMERMTLRSLPSELVLPVGSRRFRGREVAVPADPEGFLADRYGPSWHVEDPYDDWPWQLEDERETGDGKAR